MSLVRLSPHVLWMPPGPPDRPSLCAVTGERGTLMLDSGASDAHVRLFLAGLDELALPRPRFVALTHWHWDHVFGAAEIGAPLVAHSQTARELAKLAAYDWSDAALDARVAGGEEIAFCADNLKLELPAPRQVRVALPDILFDESLTIDLGNVTCRLQHAGGDHSADSIVAFIEPDGMLFLGDCLYDDIYAPTRHYTTAKLFPLLDTLGQFEAVTAVEGHSPDVLDRAALDHLIRRLRLIGQLADQHPGDEAGLTAAWMTLHKRAPDEDDADLIRAFAAAPRMET
jgi:glyoxylase-like metal-dependent hydrolase (beta-lactamase superfamily II)